MGLIIRIIFRQKFASSEKKILILSGGFFILFALSYYLQQLLHDTAVYLYIIGVVRG